LLYYPIFYNPNLLIGNKSVFFKSWCDAGIHCKGDIYKNGSFISVDELNKMYNLKINFINYIGVTRAIDTFLKKILYILSYPTYYQTLFAPIITTYIKQERRMTEQYTPDSCAIGDDTLMIDVFVLEISKKNNNNLYN